MTPTATKDTSLLRRLAAAGAGGYALNLAVFAALVHGVAITPPVAAAVAFAAGAGSIALLDRAWPARCRGGLVSPRSGHLVGMSVGALALNLLVLAALLAIPLSPLPAQALAVVTVAPVGLLGNRLGWLRPATAPPAAGALRESLLARKLARYRTIVAWWAVSRAAVLGAALVVQAIGWPRPTWYPPISHRPLALLGAWDGRWYAMVANRGYLTVGGRQSDTAFFPLFPVAMRSLHALGLPLLDAGLLLSSLGFLVGLIAFFELARGWVGETSARRAAIYAAVFPFGFVFSMQYPEGLAFGLIALAGLAAARGRYTACAAASALATLARAQGLFLALPIAVLVLRRWRVLEPRERARAVVAALAAPAAQAGLSLYVWRVTGDAFAYESAQRAWGRWTSPDGIVRALQELRHAMPLHREWLFRDAAFCLVYLVALALAARAGVPRSWLAMGAAVVLLPLWTGSFTSDARFGLLALPVYVGLASLARNRWLDGVLRATSLAMLTAASATILLHWP